MIFRIAMCWLLLFPVLTMGATRVKVGTAPAEFTSSVRAARPEPVSMSGFHFEVNVETSRVRVVVDYAYSRPSANSDDDPRGPASTAIAVDGLSYDIFAKQIVYSHEGIRVVCATVQVGKSGPKARIKNTGRCFVTATQTEKKQDDGWELHWVRELDLYFETH